MKPSIKIELPELLPCAFEAMPVIKALAAMVKTYTPYCLQRERTTLHSAVSAAVEALEAAGCTLTESV